MYFNKLTNTSSLIYYLINLMIITPCLYSQIDVHAPLALGIDLLIYENSYVFFNNKKDGPSEGRIFSQVKIDEAITAKFKK